MNDLRHWIPALSALLCLGLGAGLIGVYGFFVEPLSEEFDVGVAVINIGPAALLLVPGIVSPFVGRIADRLPVRRMVLIGATIAMCALLAITRVEQLLAAGLLFLVFSFGLTFYGPVVMNGLMVRHYPGQEARALAIAAIGISVASAGLPPLMGYMLSHLPWREALAWLAGGVWLTLVLVVLGGLPAASAGSVRQAVPRATGLLRRREFWLIGFCVAMGLSVSVVIAVIYPPYFVTEGYTLEEAGWLLSVAGLSGLTGKVLVGWIGDAGRPYAKWLAAVLLAMQVIGFTILLQVETVPGVVLALFFLGFGMGAFLPMQPYLNSCYFEAETISEVIGSQMPLFLPFGLIGTPLAGYVYDRTGSYDPVMIGLACLSTGAILLALALPAPRS